MEPSETSSLPRVSSADSPDTAPPELDATPERGSSLPVSVSDTAPPELDATPERGSSRTIFFEGTVALEPARGGGAEPTDASESGDEPAGDDGGGELSGDWLDIDPSPSANASPGVVATAHPTPRTTANPPTRPMQLALPM